MFLKRFWVYFKQFFSWLAGNNKDYVKLTILQIDDGLPGDVRGVISKQFKSFCYTADKKELQVTFNPNSAYWLFEYTFVERVIPSKNLVLLFQFFDRKGNVTYSRMFEKLELISSSSCFDCPGCLNSITMSVEEIFEFNNKEGLNESNP